MIICAKAIKTIYAAAEQIQDEIPELTGIYYIPASLNEEGFLSFAAAEKKLPWFPREYLLPMVEPKLAIGDADAVDRFISGHVDRIEKIKSWSDYVRFFREYYEAVAESSFMEKTVRNMEGNEPEFELEENMYIFLDNTVYSTFHIMNLYNHLQVDNQPKALYDNFLSIQETEIKPLAANDVIQMQDHCGQMNGEYPLSPSQREAVNHFNVIEDGDVLAVNGPPGTGKTTLLQTIVADMYVKRAIEKDKAPLIVASSTNNQAVTNIIASFGNIKGVGIANLEERWIEGVNSFATYFPSTSKVKEAKSKGYQYTNQKGEFFVGDVEDQENIEKSQAKLLRCCNKFFSSRYENIAACQDRLHQELLFLEESKKQLLLLAEEVTQYDLRGQTFGQRLENLLAEIEGKQEEIAFIRQRILDWQGCYKRIPFYVKWLKFIKTFAGKIATEFRLFIDHSEQGFLNEYMTIDEIKEKYSIRHARCNQVIAELKQEKTVLENIKNRYDKGLAELRQHNIELHEEKEERYRLDLDYVNGLLDKKHRYVQFWLAVHYYECRWARGEDELTEKQKGKNFINVLEKFYNRLSMITPCLVMTFYMLPRQFLAFSEQKNVFLFNHIDLLIVDEGGQVSPEIAAGAFSLAKKAIVVGDIHQIETVWSVNKALDKALALANGAIQSLDEFELLEQTGLNSSDSSVMKVAAKCCRYEKFGEKGLFLSEHRRCYDEIIDYCNKLVYKGNLQPLRGRGKGSAGLAIKHWPQMGFRQIDTESSTREGSSRANRREAEQIAEWLKNNFKIIAGAYPKEPKENLVGIITPFKAQVQCIKAELKKQLPPEEHSKISVGTVHTFQGAERKIIILSTVYGKEDGCYFIDANKSLMNVALSRDKDNFFLFGDIHCLKDTAGSASGLLKQCVGVNPIE
ncbi:MAG: AAA domain-containing protein [Clostridiales bacterium]